MSGFPEREDRVAKFLQNECADCDKTAELVDRHQFDYWLSYGFEKGHSGDMSYIWVRHNDDWRCRECAEEFFFGDEE